MESLAQPPPPPGSLQTGGGGAASRLRLGEAAAGEGGCREAGEGGGRRNPSPPPAPAPAAAPRAASPSRAAEGGEAAEGAGLAVPESPGAAPALGSGPAGAGSGSSGAPSPPGEESRSLDSLESFSNLHSCCPSSSELNSDADEAVVAGASSGGPAPEPEGDRPAAGSQLLSASKERFPGQSVYHIKWVRWKEENTPVITQNENGPCPLLAIMNVLLLAWKVPAGGRHGGAGRAVPLGQRSGLPSQRGVRARRKVCVIYDKDIIKNAGEELLTRAGGDSTRGNGFKLAQGNSDTGFPGNL